MKRTGKSVHVRWCAPVMLLLAAGLLSGCAQPSNEPWSTRPRLGGWGPQHAALGATGSLTVDLDRVEMYDAAVDVLEQALNSTNPLLRANAIEALHYAPEHLEQAVLAGLGDANRGVRFIAAMTAGKFRLRNLAHLVHPLLQDESQSVQAAAIYALHRSGENVDLNPLAKMVVSMSPEVKANAALVLGELGNESAIAMLRRAAGRGLARVHVTHAQIVDLQIAEAIVKLGDERQLDVIRAALFAPGEKAEVIALACLMCGRLGDGRAASNLEDLSRRGGDRRLPPEVRMAATLALAQIAPGSARVEVPLEYATSGRMELRAQAAMTLGAIRTPAAMNALRQLLADSSPLVQVAAAAGILQQLGS